MGCACPFLLYKKRIRKVRDPDLYHLLFNISMIKRTGMWPGAPAGCVSPFLQRKVITEQLKPFKQYPYSSQLV